MMTNEDTHKSNQKRLAGEFEKRAGEKAYSATGWSPYGFFAMLDRAQSAVTGYTMTPEVTQIRRGERFEAEANSLHAKSLK